MEDVFEDKEFGLLYRDEDSEQYNGTLELSGDRKVRISIYNDPDGPNEDGPNMDESLKYAYINSKWIKKNEKWILETCIHELIYRFDYDDINHPMWDEMYKKKVKNLLNEIEICYIFFYGDGRFAVYFEQEGMYEDKEIEINFLNNGDIEEIDIR